jgi:hypothetical protein
MIGHDWTLIPEGIALDVGMGCVASDVGCVYGKIASLKTTCREMWTFRVVRSRHR